ncbi:MFS transporter [Pontiella sulfatireligans]|uniref:Putative symporter YjmB n=1 Tax=Pontiella sulfatireligans TaxID=2750658 RepID=A0A6C2UT28_9BACT|nr:MFS transporter [Pontiella sulfatireligans]VGO23490.1 putative symporter YjmB [Pontiella sulfatireligans]
MSEALEHEKELNREATKPEDRVPFGQKFAYSMGVVSDHYANVCLSMFMTAFFVDFLKLGAAMVGYAMGTARCWDAFTDPVVGTLSDRSKSRFGRRKPFIFVGAILTGLFFPVIWMVPEGWAPAAISAYLFIALLIFYTFYSIFSVPYEALGAELTPDYKERSSIFVVRSVVQQVFNLGIIWIFPFAMWLATKAWIGGEVNGVRAVSWLIAVMVVVAGIIPALGCVERYREIAKKQEKTEFWTGVKALLRNKPYLIIIGTICTYLFSIIATMNLAYFVNVYYVYGGEIQAGAILGGIDGTLRFFFSVAAAWGIKMLGDRYDKHHMLMGCVTMLMFSFVGIYFTTLPGHPWLTLVMKPFLAIGEVGFWVLVLSMRADVCDWDEHQTGKRNEGLIAASMNWVNKMAITMAVIVSGLLLQNVVKFDSNLNEKVASLVSIEELSVIKGQVAVEETPAYKALLAIEKEDGDAVTLEQLVEKMELQAVEGITEQQAIDEAKEQVAIKAAVYKALLAADKEDDKDNAKDGITLERLTRIVELQAVLKEQVVIKEQIATKAKAAFEALPATEKEGKDAVTLESLNLTMEQQAMTKALATLKEEVASKAPAEFAALPAAKKEGKEAVTLESLTEKMEQESMVNLKALIAIEAATAYQALPAAEKEGEEAVTLERLTKTLEQKQVMRKQSPGTMQRLRICYTLPPVIALAICLLLMWKYPLTHDRLSKVRKELEDRRGKTIET